MIENYEVILRLVLALCLGSLLGIQRLYAGKTAGMRTFALISLGSALFVIISEQIIGNLHFDVDPLRVAASIISGVGFIGAGMIIFQKEQIANLTTAAGVWVSAGIGMAVGFGLYTESIVVTFLVIFTFTAMWNIEQFIKNKFNK
jgi:putative Mg2+ transporter-C (MgtC) family protein